jgi:hypothetical protein
MMPGADAKAVLLLAASDLNGSELKTFFKEVERAGSSEMVRRIDHVRMMAADEVPQPFSYRESHVSARDAEHKNIVAKIENLLVYEANLPKTRASHILYSEIQEELGDSYYLPSPNKVAFRLWLSRLLDQVPPSTVLHIASRLRNSIVHGDKSLSDWPLNS